METLEMESPPPEMPQTSRDAVPSHEPEPVLEEMELPEEDEFLDIIGRGVDGRLLLLGDSTASREPTGDAVSSAASASPDRCQGHDGGLDCPCSRLLFAFLATGPDIAPTRYPISR